jgi:iron complex outermembrane receptor protein
MIFLSTAKETPLRLMIPPMAFLFFLFFLFPIVSSAQTSGDNLISKSIEELMNVEVISVSKKEERLFQTAAAIYVITQEDIRRSGLTSIPELLRLAPGVSVARIDGNKWAISARGFNNRFTNKLLVMIDGRSVYTPLTTGVYWDAQDLLLEDIERIEVIRGPGGTLWGANAVNGVINIITRNAQDTQGGLLTQGFGSTERSFGGARIGGKLGKNAFYRVYARYFDRDPLVDPSGAELNDGHKAVRGGFRIDWPSLGRDALSLHGDIFTADFRENSTHISLLDPLHLAGNTPGEFNGGNLMGQWRHEFSAGSDMTLQLYADRYRRTNKDIGIRIDTYDLDFQHHRAFGPKHDIVWGGGYRLVADQTNTSIGPPIQWRPDSRRTQIFSLFAQDEITLIPERLRLTLGAKLERNDFTGFETQPNGRILWTPTAKQTIWGAVSRAVKIPARNELGIRVNPAAFVGAGGITNVIAIFGSPDFQAETLHAFEAGYRARPTSRLSIDIAMFFNLYDHLLTTEPDTPFLEASPPPVHLVLPRRYQNKMDGQTHGIEASVNFDVTSRWRTSMSYSWLRMHLRRYATSRDTTAETLEGLSPQHQFQAHSNLVLPYRFDFDASLYRISSLPTSNIPAYTRVDFRFGWRAKEQVELSLNLQNLFDNRHPEFNSAVANVIPGQVRRNLYGKIVWTF